MWGELRNICVKVIIFFSLLYILDAKVGAKIKEWKLTGMDEILTDLEVFKLLF